MAADTRLLSGSVSLSDPDSSMRSTIATDWRPEMHDASRASAGVEGVGGCAPVSPDMAAKTIATSVTSIGHRGIVPGSVPFRYLAARLHASTHVKAAQHDRCHCEHDSGVTAGRSWRVVRSFTPLHVGRCERGDGSDPDDGRHQPTSDVGQVRERPRWHQYQRHQQGERCDDQESDWRGQRLT